MERERRTKSPVLSVREERSSPRSRLAHLQNDHPLRSRYRDAPGEILAQRWEDIDFDNRLLYVRHSKTPEGEMREIPLTRRLYDLLCP